MIGEMVAIFMKQMIFIAFKFFAHFFHNLSYIFAVKISMADKKRFSKWRNGNCFFFQRKIKLKFIHRRLRK